MVTRLKGISLNGEIKGIEVEGLLTELEEVLAKNGIPFVKGILRDNDISCSFKHWDITMEDFLKKYGLPTNKKSFVVQVKGNLDVYEGEPQIIVKGGVVLTTRENAINNYINCAPYDYEFMFNQIVKVQDLIKNPILKRACAIIITEHSVFQKLEFMPYSDEVHMEKAGWLHHLYNMLAYSCIGIGEPKEKASDGINFVSLINKDIILTSIMLYNFSPFYLYEVDEESGVIENKDKALLLNKGLNNVLIAEDSLKKALTKLKAEYEKGEIEEEVSFESSNADIEGVKHCIAVMNDLIDPEIPEAFYCKNLKNLELQTFKAVQVKKSMPYLQDSVKYTLNGEKHYCVNLK